jgi:hypothetical protein
MSNIKFLGLHIDETLSWKFHIDQIVTKMSSACYAIRTVKGFMSQETLKMIYFSYVHCIMEYGIIFRGNLSNSIKVFRMQKRIIRVIMNARTRDSCRDLFKNLNILPMYSQYTYSIILFVVKNKDLYKSNHEIHSFSTRHSTNLYFPTLRLTVFQKGPDYSGIRAYNHLPSHIKNLSNEMKLFKPSLKRFLLSNLFYSLDEYFNCKLN